RDELLREAAARSRSARAPSATSAPTAHTPLHRCSNAVARWAQGRSDRRDHPPIEAASQFRSWRAHLEFAPFCPKATKILPRMSTAQQPSLLFRIAPGLRPLLHYHFGQDFRFDFIAGVSVAAVALPVAVAYAELAGFTPEVGLYSCILPLVAYA